MIPFAAIVLVVSALSRRGAKSSRGMPWTPMRETDGWFGASILLRAIASPVAFSLIVGAASPGLESQLAGFGVAAALSVAWLPGLFLPLFVRVLPARLVGFYVDLCPPIGARIELAASRVFYPALAHVRRGTSTEAEAERLERHLGRIERPGPTWLATRALISAMRGRDDEARATLADVLTLDGRGPGVFALAPGKIPWFVSAFAERELVARYLAAGDFHALLELRLFAKGRFARFAMAVAERAIGTTSAPSDAWLVCLFVFSPNRFRLYPILRATLDHPRRATPPDPKPPVSLEEALARALRLGRIGDIRERTAEATVVLEYFDIEGWEIEARCEARLEAIGGTSDPDRCIDEVFALVDDAIADAFARVPLTHEHLGVRALDSIVDEQAEEAWARFLEQVRELEVCASDTLGERYARGVRAFRLLALSHARILALDPGSRAQLFERQLVSVWNRGATIGDGDGNWLLAHAIFQWLLNEARVLGKSEPTKVLTKNTQLFT